MSHVNVDQVRNTRNAAVRLGNQVSTRSMFIGDIHVGNDIRSYEQKIKDYIERYCGIKVKIQREWDK